MATTSKSEKIFIGIDDQVIELTGADKEAFLLDQAQMKEERLLLETARLEKETARASAITKLAEIAGLTEEEINSII
jgi:hypothetical protein